MPNQGGYALTYAKNAPDQLARSFTLISGASRLNVCYAASAARMQPIRDRPEVEERTEQPLCAHSLRKFERAGALPQKAEEGSPIRP